MDWQISTTKTFDKAIKKLKKDKPARERILNGVKEIMLDPYHNSKIYIKWKMFSRRFDPFRIIYQICENCRLRGVESSINCEDCENTPDHTVRFFMYEHRDHVYD